MNQIRRSANSTSEREMITMAEEELARLYRQLRIMEEDRVAFADETGSKLEKQRRIIQTLREEKQKLREDIDVANCLNQKRKDEKLSKDVYKLLDDYERYEKYVREEKNQIVEMDVQIKKLERDIKKQRPKSAITDNYFQQRLTSGQRAVQMLQNRLDNMVKKFCCVLAQNKRLRGKIDHLLKERNHFNDIWEKLLKDINNGKKFMVDLIEQATIAFDQREEWCSKLEALKKRTENDYVIHAEEMRDIQRKLDHYLTLREFLCVKGQRRVLRDLEEKERKKKEAQMQELENELQVYEQTLQKIQEFCGEEDIERIAALFIKQEEENFALFNYVNELNHEIESLNAGMEELHAKIDEQIEISQMRANERQATLKTLECDFEIAKKEADANEASVKLAENALTAVLNGIKEIFKLVDCDRGPILELLGANKEINLFNVKIYLGMIEKKVSTLITAMYFAEKSIMTHNKKFGREMVQTLH